MVSPPTVPLLTFFVTDFFAPFPLFTCSCPKESWAVVRAKNGDRGKVELYAQGGHQYLEQEQPGKFSPNQSAGESSGLVAGKEQLKH